MSQSDYVTVTFGKLQSEKLLDVARSHDTTVTQLVCRVVDWALTGFTQDQLHDVNAELQIIAQQVRETRYAKPFRGEGGSGGRSHSRGPRKAS